MALDQRDLVLLPPAGTGLSNDKQSSVARGLGEEPHGPQGGFLISLLAGISGDSADAVVSAGHSKLGFHPGHVPEARPASFPQRKELLFVCVCVQMVLLPDTRVRVTLGGQSGRTGRSFPGEGLQVGLR